VAQPVYTLIHSAGSAFITSIDAARIAGNLVSNHHLLVELWFNSYFRGSVVFLGSNEGRYPR
jgi:hypothetical protein